MAIEITRDAAQATTPNEDPVILLAIARSEDSWCGHFSLRVIGRDTADYAALAQRWEFAVHRIDAGDLAFVAEPFLAAESRSEAAVDWGVAITVADDELHVEVVGAVEVATAWSCYLEGLVEYTDPDPEEP